MPKLVARGRSGLFVPRSVIIHERKNTEKRVIIQSQKPGEPVFFEGEESVLIDFFTCILRRLKGKDHPLPFYDDARVNYSKKQIWGTLQGPTSLHVSKRKKKP